MTVYAYPLDYPVTRGISAAEVTPRSAVGETVSPFTGESQIQRHQGQWHEFTMVHPPMDREAAEDFLTFFAKLNGPEGTFLLPIPNAQDNRGGAFLTPGTPVVDGASQVGNDLNIRTAPLSETDWLIPGDHIQIDIGANARYHKVLEPVNTTGGGLATIVIWPSLRNSPNDGVAIEVQNPKGVFRLAGENPVRYEIDTAKFYRFQVDVREVV